jgi:hypothetical protein
VSMNRRAAGSAGVAVAVALLSLASAAISLESLGFVAYGYQLGWALLALTLMTVIGWFLVTTGRSRRTKADPRRMTRREQFGYAIGIPSAFVGALSLILLFAALVKSQAGRL